MENSTAEEIIEEGLKYYVAFVYPKRDLVSKVAGRLKAADIEMVHFSSNEELFEAMNEKIPCIIVSKLIAENINAIKVYVATRYMSEAVQPKVIGISENNKKLKKIALTAGLDQVIEEPISYIKLQAIIQSWVYAIDEAKKDKEFQERSKTLFSDKEKEENSKKKKSSSLIDNRAGLKVFSGETNKINNFMTSKKGTRYPWQSKDTINIDIQKLADEIKAFEKEALEKFLLNDNGLEKEDSSFQKETKNKEIDDSNLNSSNLQNISLKDRLKDFKNNPEKRVKRKKRQYSPGKHLDIKFLLKGADFILENKDPSSIVSDIINELKVEIDATKCLLVKFKENNEYSIFSKDKHDNIFTPERIEEIKGALQYKNYFIESFGVTDKSSKLMIPVLKEDETLGCLYFEKHEKNFSKQEVEAIERSSKGFKVLFKIFYKDYFTD